MGAAQDYVEAKTRTSAATKQGAQRAYQRERAEGTARSAAARGKREQKRRQMRGEKKSHINEIAKKPGEEKQKPRGKKINKQRTWRSQTGGGSVRTVFGGGRYRDTGTGNSAVTVGRI